MNHQIAYLPSPTFNNPALKAGCVSCRMQQLCLPMGLNEEDVARFDAIISDRRPILKNKNLYRMGDPFRNLYAIRFGHFKTYHINPSGEQQITGFQMAGELLGMDAIGTHRHQSDAIALEDSEICEIPFSKLEELFGSIPMLLRHFHKMLSQEIMRGQNMMLLMGNMHADQRFAVFLVNLSAHYATRGYSPTRFQLRMSREDIGNYLGLTIESISRLVSRFKKQGWLRIDKREVLLIEPAILKVLASGAGMTTYA